MGLHDFMMSSAIQNAFLLLCTFLTIGINGSNATTCISSGLQLKDTIEASAPRGGLGTTIVLCGDINVTEIFPIDLSNKNITILCGKPRSGKKINRRCKLDSEFSNKQKIFTGNNTHLSVTGVSFRSPGRREYPGTQFASNGGALLFSHSTLILRECSFIGNAATFGGAIHLSGSSSTLILQGGTKFNPMIFQGNAAYGGGGIWMEGKRLVIRPNTHFIGNSGCEVQEEGGPSPGGGIYAFVQNLNMKGVLFQSNRCVEGFGRGSVRVQF